MSPPASRCPSCRGLFIPFLPYLEWQEHQTIPPASLAAATPLQQIGPASPSQPVAPESETPRLCPGCGRLMRRYRVALDLPFHIDRCGGCASFWFDAGEWEALTSHTGALHLRLNHLFSASWQQAIHHQEQLAQREHRVQALLGPEAYTTAARFKYWLAAQQQRPIILAYLDDREIDSPSRR